jgi:hypothetical protein
MKTRETARDENGAIGAVTTGEENVTGRSCGPSAERNCETALHPAVDDWGLDEL